MVDFIRIPFISVKLSKHVRNGVDVSGTNRW